MNGKAEVEPESHTGSPDNDPTDELLIAGLAEGWTHAEAGKQAGVSAKTVQRRLKDPEFAGAVARRRRERVERLTAQLITASDAAVCVLRDALGSGDPKVSLRAATLILSHTGRFHGGEEEREVARRQDELELRVQESLDTMTAIAGVAGEGGRT